MAVRINPCHGCPLREGCEQRDEFRRRVRGLGLRSATFRCQKLDDALRQGRRIMVATPRIRDCGSGYYPDHRVEMVAVPATITGSRDGEFTCVIDPGHVYGQMSYEGDEIPPDEKYRFRRKQRASRIIRFLDEPDMEVCKDGGRVQRNGACDRPPGEICYCEQTASLLAEIQEFL